MATKETRKVLFHLKAFSTYGDAYKRNYDSRR